MKCSQNEERLSNLVFIFMNEDLLKKMKGERGNDIFYNKIINEIPKNKRRIELTNKFDYSLLVDFIIFSRNQ